jgi:hypothetical protein
MEKGAPAFEGNEEISNERPRLHLRLPPGLNPEVVDVTWTHTQVSGSI